MRISKGANAKKWKIPGAKIDWKSKGVNFKEIAISSTGGRVQLYSGTLIKR